MWTIGEVTMWGRGHSIPAMLLWQPHWNEGGGLLALMAEPSLSVLIWHKQAQLGTHCLPPPSCPFPPLCIEQSIRQSTYCRLFLAHILAASSTLETMHGHKSQERLQLCKHVAGQFVLYICTHNENISRCNAACAWPSFSKMQLLLPLSCSCLLALQFLNALSTPRVLLLLELL